MRITFLLPPLNISGGIRVLAIYADRLSKRGHQIQVLSLPKPQKRFRSKIKSLLTGYGWPASPSVEDSHFDGLAVSVRHLENQNPSVSDFPDADVVFATFWKTGPIVSQLPTTKGVKAIFLQGYETSPGYENPEIDAVWRLPLRKVVISDWMVKLAKERFGDSEVFHVPNSVDTEQFYSPQRDKQVAPTVGMLYGSIHLKGIDVTNAALELVRRDYPNLRIIAFGAEPVTAALPLPKGAEYHLRPRQETIRELYAECDLWVCGSRREGFHLPPLEAMACRCPVVSTKVGGPLDIIKDGVNGFLVDIEDYNALAARIVQVLNMKNSDWKRMSDAAYITAQGYSWDDATLLLEKCLERFCKEKSDLKSTSAEQ